MGHKVDGLVFVNGWLLVECFGRELNLIAKGRLLPHSRRRLSCRWLRLVFLERAIASMIADSRRAIGRQSIRRRRDIVPRVDMLAVTRDRRAVSQGGHVVVRLERGVRIIVVIL